MNIQELRFSFRSLNTAIFAVLFVLLPIVYIHQVFETASIPRHILISSVAYLLLLLYSIQIFSQKVTFTLSFLHISFLVFLCWGLLSILWSVDVKNSVTELTQLSFYFIILFTASQLEIKQIKIIFSGIFIGASIAAVIGILQAFNLNPLDLTMTTPLASTFNNKNHASVFFDLVIPLALISMLTTKSHEKYIASITYTLIVTFILLAKTKGSILGYIVFSLFFLIFIYKNKSIQKKILHKRNIIHYLFLSFVIPLSIYTLANTQISGTTSSTPISWSADLTKSSVSVRLAWYKNAYKMLENNPIAGVGYGAFRQGFAPYASNPNIVKSLTEDQAVAQLHNDPYQNFLELGIVGGSLIVFIFTYMIFKGSSLLLTVDGENEDNSNYLLLGSILALTTSITHSFVDFPTRLPSSATLFWFLTGIIILLLNNSKSKITLKNKTIKIATALGFLLLSFVLLIRSYDLYGRYFSASKLTYAATVSIQKENNCTKAKNEIDQALNLFFEDPFIRQRYIQIYIACESQLDKKLSAMNRVLNYDSSNARARLSRGQILLDNRKIQQARADFEYLIYVLPHRPAAYLGLGDIATLKNNYKLARKYYELAKILDPVNQRALFMLKQLNEKGV